MEAIPGKIISELLPFIVQSDMFFDWAERTSSGSLSPRTKWKALAEFEFPLPPIERQKEILEVLEKVKTIDGKVSKTKDQLSRLLDGFYRDYLAKKLKIEDVANRPLMIKSCAPIKKLNELINGKIQNGLFVKNGVTHRNKAIFLNVQDIYGFPPKIVDALVSVTCTDKDLTSFKLKTGDVIYNRSSLVKDGIGWAYLCTDINRETVYDCHLMRVTPKDELLPEYLLLYSISPWARKYFMCISQTTTMTTIGQVELGSLPIPFPNMELQLEIVKLYQTVVELVKIAEKKQRNIKTLNSQIISKLLGNNGGVK
jgi:type I restriction enzyme S subunit